MGITSITRDWGTSPSIVRISTTDTLAQVESAGYLLAQQDNIEQINKGTFEWSVSDSALVYASDGSAYFEISPDFQSLVLETSGGGGTITQINTGAGLTGGPITTTGTIALAPIADQTFLANTSGIAASPIATPLSTVLQSANNLDDLPSRPAALANIGQGSGDSVYINDSDFILGVYQIVNPFPKELFVTVGTPGLEVRLPLANQATSPAIGQGVYVNNFGSTESIEVTYPSGSLLQSIDEDGKYFFSLQDNSTSDGIWEAYSEVDLVNGKNGIVILNSSDIDVDPAFTPANYTPVAGSWDAASITGNLAGIDAALGAGAGSSPPQFVYVANSGSDITGDGTIQTPYETLSYALSQIVDADATKPYEIVMVTGVYTEVDVPLKPWIYIDLNSSALTVSNSITLDPSWFGASGNCSMDNGIGCSYPANVTLDFLAAGAAFSYFRLANNTGIATGTVWEITSGASGTVFVANFNFGFGNQWAYTVENCFGGINGGASGNIIFNNTVEGFDTFFSVQNLQVQGDLTFTTSTTTGLTCFSELCKVDGASLYQSTGAGVLTSSVKSMTYSGSLTLDNGVGGGSVNFAADTLNSLPVLLNGATYDPTSIADASAANTYFTPTNYTPIDGGVGSWSADSVVGNLAGIDFALNGVGQAESLQDAYTIGNTIQLDADRPFEVFSQSVQVPLEGVTNPSSGLSSTLNYAIQGWVFIPNVAISVTALQYLDNNLPSGSRDVGIYRKSSGALLVSTKVTKTSPLVGFYRTTTLDTPVTLSGGEEYVICVVVYPSENYNLNNDAVTAANISATQRCTGAISATPIPLSFPTTYIGIANVTPEGYFIYEVIVPNASIEFHSGQDATSYMMRSVSTTLGNIPLPVMSTDDFRAIPAKDYGLMAFSSDQFRPLTYNGIGQNQLVAYLSDVTSLSEGGAYPISIDAVNTVGANSISVIYSAWQRVGRRASVTLRLTFVPTQIDPVIAVHANLNVIPYPDDTYAGGTGSLWLDTAPTGLDGSVKVSTVAAAPSIAINMIAPAFDSVLVYEMNAVYNYEIDPILTLDPFITIWNTATVNPVNTVISLPLVASGTYSFIVDWGDLSFDVITAYNDAAATHTYADPGQYTVKIYGTLTGWSFTEVPASAPNIIDVTQWGTAQIGDLATAGYFNGTTYLENISATDAPDLTTAVSMYLSFGNSALINIANAAAWNTSSTFDMSSCFQGSVNFTGAGVPSWDTSNVTNMESMFDGAVSADQDYGTFDVANLTNGINMFNGVTLSTANYDALLVGWSGQAVQSGVTFSGGNSTYSVAGAAARAILTGTYLWVITDGGPA